MLIIGLGAAVDAFVGAVTPHLRAPVRSVVCPELPSHLPGDGTIILRSVDSLDADQQERLARLLDEPRGSHTQVISITARPLYVLVQAGMFLDRLYYRLNVVHFEVVSE
jgi:Sigma-54 interaction domain